MRRRDDPAVRSDLVILDLFMPNVDGFAVLKWIRKQPDLRALPVVVLTSSMRTPTRLGSSDRTRPGGAAPGRGRQAPV